MSEAKFLRVPGGWCGPQRPGALAEHRKKKRIQAVLRADFADPAKRRKARCPDDCGHRTHKPPSRRRREGAA